MTDSIDTNVVLRYILNDIPEQKQKIVDFLNNDGSTHYFSNQALLEAIYVLEKEYDVGRDKIAAAINFFLTRYDGIVSYDSELTKIAFPLYLAHPKLSWVDCALAAEAEVRHREPLMTFDQKLANQVASAKLVG